MSIEITYKGYTGSMEIDAGGNCLFGKIKHIDDLVTYEAQTVPKLKEEFVLAVKDYLADRELMKK